VRKAGGRAGAAIVGGGIDLLSCDSRRLTGQEMVSIQIAAGGSIREELADRSVDLAGGRTAREDGRMGRDSWRIRSGRGDAASSLAAEDPGQTRTTGAGIDLPMPDSAGWGRGSR
jgi:hypothetical protein